MIRPKMFYEPNKTYPFVLGNRIVEVDGAVINEYYTRQPITLTYIEYKSIIDRIENLENMVGIK